MFKSWKETILKEYPRLTPESKFKFNCHKGLSCFTQCCANVNIFLTPYDVLRMRKALNLSSEEFLNKYTFTPFIDDQKIPLVLLRMQDNDQETCPLITSNGCSIYEDRPWSCRMFPLGMASAKTAEQPDGLEFCFIVEEGFSCLGFNEDKEWTVAEWMKDQEIDLYDKKCEPYKEITLHKQLREGKELGTAKSHVFYITLYDLDRFRRLVLESTFLHRFDISEELVEKIKVDDEELLNFGYDWLKFSLFGEDTIKIKGEVLEEKKKELSKSNNEESS